MMISFTDLSFWQRVVATSSLDEAWKGLKKSTWKTMFIWTVPILACMLIRVKGYEVGDLASFIAFTRDSSYLTSLILFPAVIVGFTSALFSSADVAIIAVVHALSDQNTFLKAFENLSYKRFKRYLTIFTITILMILSGLYWIKYLELTNYFVPLVYACLGQIIILSSLSGYVVYKISQGEYAIDFNANILFNGVLFGWACVISGVILSVNYDSLGMQQAAIIVGTISILITTVYSARAGSRKKVHFERRQRLTN